MADKVTLISNDAQIMDIVHGTEKTGDAIKTLDEHAGGAAASGAGKGLWLVTAKAAAASIFAGLNIGEHFLADGDEVPATGDKMQFVESEAVIFDATSFKANFTADEHEVGLQHHKVKKYRKGKADADGSLKGRFTIGVTDEPGALLNTFIKVVKKTATVGPTISDVIASPRWVKAYVRQTFISGELCGYLIAQIELFNMSLGADSGAVQEYDSKFRFTGPDPVFYQEEVA